MAIRALRWLGIAALIIGYALLAHYTSASTENGNLGAIVAITPVLLISLLLAWRSKSRMTMLSVLAFVCIALWSVWPILEKHFGLVYWIQHVGMQLILFMTFGRTLLSGQKPLCTRFAEQLHSSPEKLTLPHAHYTRQVTLAWTLFFAVMALVSTLMFFLTPLATWSIFANFLTLPLVAIMFIAEYWVRKQVLPDIKHVHIFDAVRAYWATSARSR